MSITNRTWPAKRAAEVDDRGIDWTNDLANGESITTQTYTVPAGATVAVDSVTKVSGKNITLARLSGGTSGTPVQVTGSITTSSGRELEVEMTLVIT